MNEQSSLKERALAARAEAFAGQARKTHEASVRHRAETIQHLTANWAQLGVVACACQVREDPGGAFYFVHEGYRLGLGRYGGLAIWQEVERYWDEICDPDLIGDPLEHLAIAMLRIDEWRIKHRAFLADRESGPCDPADCACCELDAAESTLVVAEVTA